jgi:putative ABC transport system substrate-binding protein
MCHPGKVDAELRRLDPLTDLREREYAFFSATLSLSFSAPAKVIHFARVFQQLELAQKQVEILTQAFPDRKKLAVLFDAQSADQFAAAEGAAKSLNLQVQPLKLENSPYDFEAAFRSAAAASAQMVLVLSSPLFAPQSARIAELAIAGRLPTMFIFKNYVEVGGLMSYGVDFPLMYRRAADDVAKIAKGAKPADLPIERADKFEFAVNLKTAKALGVKLPTGILLRADVVIE